jgi:RNA-directed DNA polymerase
MSPPKQSPPGKTVALPRLNLYSILRLERLLGFSRGDLRRVAANAGEYYEPFKKKERLRPFQKKFKTRKPRQIDNPKGALKVIQKNIYARILKRIPLPGNLMGGVKGHTISENARVHIKGKVLAKIDIRSFFPSITNLHVYKIWRHHLNCSPEIASLLTQLTTFERHLPQGAPTSTLIANLVILSLDHPIRAESNRNATEYSGWVDDLGFSGDNPRPLINTAVRELAAAGFSVSRDKVKVMGPASQKILTGIRLGIVPRAEPRQLARVRSGIHKLRIGAVPRHEFDDYVRSLEGKISHIASIDPKKAERLLVDLRTATTVARLDAEGQCT